MGTIFPPRADADLLAWSITFLNGISPEPTPLGLSPAMITSYSTAQGIFAECMAQVADPAVRTTVITATKNNARKNLVTSIRLLTSVINGQASVTPEQKMALGIPVRKKPAPVPTPSTPPVMVCLGVTGWKATISFSEMGSKKPRPESSIATLIYTYVGANPPANTDDWVLFDTTGKSKVDVLFSNTLAAGTKVWITSCWMGSRKQRSVCAQPMAILLQGGNAVPNGASLKIAA